MTLFTFRVRKQLYVSLVLLYEDTESIKTTTNTRGVKLVMTSSQTYEGRKKQVIGPTAA